MTANHLLAQLQDVLGAGYPASSSDIAWAWEIAGVEVAVADWLPERELRAAWKTRQGGGATPLLLITPAGAPAETTVLGPTSATDPIRIVPFDMLKATLTRVSELDRRDAVVTLAAELERIDTAGIPGVTIRGLLTRHILEHRLRRGANWKVLEERAVQVRADRSWRDNLGALGWSDSEKTSQGYLYRKSGAPCLVVHPLRDASDFGRVTTAGSLPEGALIAECRSRGARWGMLSTNERFRLFRADDGSGSSTGRYLEFDLTTTQHDDWPYLGLLHTDSLGGDGLLERLMEEAEQFGAGLRDRLEDCIRDEVMPLLAHGLGRSAAADGKDLTKPVVREEIEGAVITLLFRLLFLFYCESQGYLPLDSGAYKPHALTTLARSARDNLKDLDAKASFYWDSFTVLVKAVRLGNRTLGVPAYNGDLFGESGLLGSELLEGASLTDDIFGHALAAVGFDPEAEDPALGVDYAGLEVEHLGRIYENLLSLRLSMADVDLKTVTAKVKGRDVETFVPTAPKDAVIVSAGQLFFQTEEGGRKAGGVYYTRQDIVRHLTTHSVLPALRAHLDDVAEIAETDPPKAANDLFKFRVLDPAMGSAHFLADALDIVADEIQDFLARRPLPGVTGYLEELRAHVQTELAGPVEDGWLLRRLVLKHCIYGADLSPMAVEVSKITLWLKSFVPGLTLSYLNHNLRCGNSLVGVATDDALVGTANLVFFHAGYEARKTEARRLAYELADVGDRTPDEVVESEQLTEKINEAIEPIREIFDLWTADALGVDGARHLLETEVDDIMDGTPSIGASDFLSRTEEVAKRHRFLHWPVAFPEVFSGDRPGFDVVIGNPPWEEVTIEELAFYALYQPGLRGMTSEHDRRSVIEKLQRRFPELPGRLEQRKTELEELRTFFTEEGGYRLQGVGDTDLYQLFCERYTHLARDGGWLGVVLPRSTFLVAGQVGFRRWMFSAMSVRRLDFILNNRSWCFPIHPQYTIALLAAQHRVPSESDQLVTTGPSESEEAFRRNSRSDGVKIDLGLLEGWTRPMPEATSTWEVPLLPTQAAVDLFDKIRRGPRLEQGYKGVWHAFAVSELHETNDRKFFRYDEGVPVWKGRSFDQFDAHGAEPAGFACGTSSPRSCMTSGEGHAFSRRTSSASSSKTGPTSISCARGSRFEMYRERPTRAPFAPRSCPRRRHSPTRRRFSCSTLAVRAKRGLCWAS